VRESPWYRIPDRLITTSVKRSVNYTIQNPLSAAGRVAIVFIGWRAAEGKLDDDIKSLAVDVGLRSEDKPDQPEQPKTADGINATTQGDRSPIFVTTSESDVSVSTSGNSSPIVITEPAPPEE